MPAIETQKPKTMKGNQKVSEKTLWEQVISKTRIQSGSAIAVSITPTRAPCKNWVWVILCISLSSLIFLLNIFSSSGSFKTEASFNTFPYFPKPKTSISHESLTPQQETQKIPDKTGLKHIVFGIAASENLWEQRKNYVKLWWKQNEMRGFAWLDKPVETDEDEELPPIQISNDTSQFPYTNRKGHRSAIRISRIVSETLRLGLKDVRWFVMGDDDTMFVPDNLVRVLSKYDHNQFYYIGSSSESHLQNIFFSYNMAYGGGGFAISYPLAKAVQTMQDRCIQRYPELYGSDDRMQACMAELGVPLTKELGFHQYDVYGNLFGLLAAHPVTPLVSLHHLDIVEPVFPNMSRVQALKRLMVPAKLDSAALLQQSICYDTSNKWTVSVSWGYAVQIFRGIITPREIEMPSRTFLNWYRKADYTAYSFNTRAVSRNSCQKPHVYLMRNARYDSIENETVSEYALYSQDQNQRCTWNMVDPSTVERVLVYKRPDPNLWQKSPRRNCCRILDSKKSGSMKIEVGACREGEVIEA